MIYTYMSEVLPELNECFRIVQPMLYNQNIPFVAQDLHSDNVGLLGDTELVP